MSYLVLKYISHIYFKIYNSFQSKHAFESNYLIFLEKEENKFFTLISFKITMYFINFCFNLRKNGVIKTELVMLML